MGLVVLMALALAVPSSAAQRLDGRKLVLQEAEIPDTYVFDRGSSLSLVPRTREARREAARVGLVGGYYAVYRDVSPPFWRTIKSSATVGTNRDRARAFTKGTGIMRARGVRRVAVGDAGWIATSGDATSVAWYHGRVAAQVVCEKVARHRAVALALARKQERRIAAALR